jgi:hypothetical protein
MSLNDSTTRSIQIASGASRVTFDSINKFTFSLPQTGYSTGRDEVALKSLTMYYSWPNISAAKGNNTFSYSWNGVTYPVVIDTGIWSFADINSYFQQVMEKNGHYLLDANSIKQYFISLITNPTLYCLSLIVTPIPTALPAGWSNPMGVALSGNTPQIIIPASFVSLTGFVQGSYPPNVQTVAYQVNSGIPQITDVSSLSVLCNLVDNSGFSLSPNILTSFVVPNGTSSGKPIDISPYNLEWVPVQSSTIFQEITLELVDQLRRPINIRDPTGFVAILSLRRRS